MQKTSFKTLINLILVLLVTFSFSYGFQVTKKAQTLIIKGMYEEAISILEDIILDKPENGEAHYLLGRAYLLLGEEESAFESFNRAISAKKKDKKRLTYRFKELGKKYSLEYGELGLAEKLFDLAVNINPKEKRKIAKILIDEGEEISETDGYYAPKLFKLAIKYLEDQEIKSALIFDIEKINQRETIKTINLLADTIKKYINDNGVAPLHNGNLTAFSLFYSALMPYMQEGNIVAFDCWENPLYIISGEPNNNDFLIISSGRDGIREGNIPLNKITFNCIKLSDFNNDMILKNGNWIKIPKIE